MRILIMFMRSLKMTKENSKIVVKSLILTVLINLSLLPGILSLEEAFNLLRFLELEYIESQVLPAFSTTDHLICHSASGS
jgi:hypothetical protein